MLRSRLVVTGLDPLAEVSLTRNGVTSEREHQVLKRVQTGIDNQPHAVVVSAGDHVEDSVHAVVLSRLPKSSQELW